MRGGRGPDRRSLGLFLLFAAATTALTVFIAQQILGTSFADRYELTAAFDDVTGLVTGDQVKVSGVPVGRVNGIKVEYGKAEVVMEVDKDVRLPEDSTAAVQWRSVVGQRVIYLKPGRSTAMLRDGGRIRHTQKTVDLGEIVNAIGPLTRSLDPDMINKLLVAFAQTLDGNEDNINALIQNVDLLLAAFGRRSETIKELLADYETVAGAVATRDRQIAASVDNLERLTEVFANNRELLGDALTEVSQVTNSLNGALAGNEAELGRVLDNLATFSQTARQKIDQLEKMVQGLPLAMRQLFAANNGGHFQRTNAVCLNIVQGPCPFPMRLPRSEQAGANGATWTKQDEDKLRKLLGSLVTGGG